jgi:ubiquinone/menaquinone biosynthesis C-methylase UbiE
MELVMPPALTTTKSGATDPIGYYSRPGVGWLYRRRIAMGLEMIPALPKGARALEVGYASGIVLFNLANRVTELHGIDLDADPTAIDERLGGLGVKPRLVRGSVLDMANLYEDAFFDLVVCFSVMEHLARPDIALREMSRVLKPGGALILGMPAVNRFMEYAFTAIGFRGIEDHHITTPAHVWSLIKAEPHRWHADRRALPGGLPVRLALYNTFRLRKI